MTCTGSCQARASLFAYGGIPVIFTPLVLLRGKSDTAVTCMNSFDIKQEVVLQNSGGKAHALMKGLIQMSVLSQFFNSLIQQTCGGKSTLMTQYGEMRIGLADIIVP